MLTLHVRYTHTHTYTYTCGGTGSLVEAVTAHRAAVLLPSSSRRPPMTLCEPMPACACAHVSQVIRQENFVQDLNATLDWLCVPPSARALGFRARSDYPRNNDTALSARGRALLQRHLEQEHFARETAHALDEVGGVAHPYSVLPTVWPGRSETSKMWAMESQVHQCKRSSEVAMRPHDSGM